ncbi:MAG: hypothetical protein HQK55_03315 [Deltaproteobacteria bacterium]|nr:hypothetical protein [Deltaproteobacteria bacterium]
MDFIINDLSFHGQFHDLATFRESINRTMTIRTLISSFGRELYCHKNIVQAQVTPDMSLSQAVNQSLTISERRVLMLWITRAGPFWDEVRGHSPDDWLECRGEIVTDKALGEAGWCCLNEIDRRLVSLDPSKWLSTPIPVTLKSDMNSVTVNVFNYWKIKDMEGVLNTAPTLIETWDQLEEMAIARFRQLTFADDTFRALVGHPFSRSAAQRIVFLLNTLNRLKSCFDENGQRTAEGHKIYKDFFTGESGEGGHGALFTDSSDDEKLKFKSRLTFKHPGNPAQSLFCPWHGKVQTPQLRIHFSWPIRYDKPFYVVYVGPKLTKQ